MFLSTRGWASTVSALLVAILSYGFIRSWPNYFTEIKTHIGNTTTSTVTTAELSQQNSFILAGISVGATSCGFVLPKLGNRLSIAISGFTIGVGYAAYSGALLLSTFHLWLLYAICFTLVGIPMGIMHTACQNSIKASVATDKRGFAMTFFSAGNTIGPFMFPTLFTLLYTELGIVVALFVTAAMFLWVVVAGAASSDSTNEKPRLLDLGLFKQRQYLFYVIQAAFGMAAYFGSFTYFPTYLEESIGSESNLEQIESVTQRRNRVQTVMAFVELGGRVIGMFIADRFQKTSILQVVYVGLITGWLLFISGDTTAMSGILQAMNLKNIHLMYFSSSIVGLCTGCFTGILFALLVDVVPSEKHAVAAAMNQLVLGVANFSTIFAMGYFSENWSKKLPFLISAGYYVTALIMLPLVRRYNEKRLSSVPESTPLNGRD